MSLKKSRPKARPGREYDSSVLTKIHEGLADDITRVADLANDTSDGLRDVKLGVQRLSKQTQQQLPEIAVEWYQIEDSGTEYAEMRLSITEAASRVSTIRARSSTGSNLDSTESWTVLTDDSATYWITDTSYVNGGYWRFRQAIQVLPKGDALLTVQVQALDNADRPWHTEDHTFDHDREPEIGAFSLYLGIYDSVSEAWPVYAAASADEDTGSIAFAGATSAYNADPEQVADGVFGAATNSRAANGVLLGNFAIPAEGGSQEIYAVARAWAGTGKTGRAGTKSTKYQSITLPSRHSTHGSLLARESQRASVDIGISHNASPYNKIDVAPGSTITFSNGDVYTLTSQTITLSTSVLTYLYFDPLVSQTQIQTTTTRATASTMTGQRLYLGSAKGATAPELAAWFVLQDDPVISTPFLYAAQLSALTADMGDLTAGSIVITTGSDKIWLNDGGDGGLAIGGSTKASAPFRVAADGTLTATSVVLTGYVNTFRQSSDPAAPTADNEGDLWHNTNTADFGGYKASAIYRWSGSAWELSGTEDSSWRFGSTTTIDGGNVNVGSKLTVGTGTDVAVVDGSDATYRFYAGHSTAASAPVRIQKDGQFHFGDATEKIVWNGSALTVSGAINIRSTSTLTAALTMSSNGKLSVGSMGFGKEVSVGNDGIYINSNNYWYTDGDWKVGGATKNITFDPLTGNLIVTGDVVTASGTLINYATNDISGGNLTGLTITGNLAVSGGSLTVGSDLTIDGDGITLADGTGLGNEITWGSGISRAYIYKTTASGTDLFMANQVGGVRIRSHDGDVAIGAGFAGGTGNVTISPGATSGTVSIDGLTYPGTAVEGGVMYGTSSGMAITPIGSIGQVLVSQGTGAPIWSDPATFVDADTLDGQHGTYYLDRANHTGTQSAATITSGAFGAGNYTLQAGIWSGVDGAQILLTTSSTTAYALRLQDTGVASYDWTFPDTGTIQLETNTSSSKTLNLLNQGVGGFNLTVENTVTANSFSGSGASLTGVDAATLDSLDSTQFLRSDADDTMVGKLTISGDNNGAIDLLRLHNTDVSYSQYFDFSLDTLKNLNITGASGAGGLNLVLGINGLTVNRGAVFSGALSGVTSLSMGGALTGATTGAFSGAVGTGALTVTTTANAALTLVQTEAGTPHNYISFQDTGGETGYFGFSSASDDGFTIRNSTGANILLSTSGTGAISFNGNATMSLGGALTATLVTSTGGVAVGGALTGATTGAFSGTVTVGTVTTGAQSGIFFGSSSDRIYRSSTNIIYQVAGATYLTVNSSGNLDYADGTLTTTGAVSTGALTSTTGTFTGLTDIQSSTASAAMFRLTRSDISRGLEWRNYSGSTGWDLYLSNDLSAWSNVLTITSNADVTLSGALAGTTATFTSNGSTLTVGSTFGTGQSLSVNSNLRIGTATGSNAFLWFYGNGINAGYVDASGNWQFGSKTLNTTGTVSTGALTSTTGTFSGVVSIDASAGTPFSVTRTGGTAATNGTFDVLISDFGGGVADVILQSSTGADIALRSNAGASNLILNTSGNVTGTGTLGESGNRWSAVYATDFNISGAIDVGDGTAADPSFTFTSEPTTGFFKSGTNAIGVSLGGTSYYNFSTAIFGGAGMDLGSIAGRWGALNAVSADFSGALQANTLTAIAGVYGATGTFTGAVATGNLTADRVIVADGGVDTTQVGLFRAGSGGWVHIPSGGIGYLGVAGSGVASWTATAFDLTSLTLTTTGAVSTGALTSTTGTFSGNVTVDSGATDIGITFDDNAVTNRYQFTTGGNSLDSYFNVNADSTRGAYVRALSGSLYTSLEAGFGASTLRYATGALNIVSTGTTVYSISASGNHDFKTGTATFGGNVTVNAELLMGAANDIYIGSGRFLRFAGITHITGTASATTLKQNATFEGNILASAGTEDIGSVGTPFASVYANNVYATTITLDSQIQATRLVLTDDGAASPILSVRADDQAPYAVEFGNDTYHASGAYRGYLTNTGDWYWSLYSGGGAVGSVSQYLYNGTTNILATVTNTSGFTVNNGTLTAAGAATVGSTLTVTGDITMGAGSEVHFNTSGANGLSWDDLATLRFSGQNEGVQVQPYSSAYVAFSVKGKAGQTYDLTQWKDSTGVVMSSVGASGQMSIGSTLTVTGATTLAALTISGSFTTEGDIILKGPDATAITGYDSDKLRLRSTYWTGTASANDDIYLVAEEGGSADSATLYVYQNGGGTLASFAPAGVSIPGTLTVTGLATFYNDINCNGDIEINADNKVFRVGASNDGYFYHSGTDTILGTYTGGLILEGAVSLSSTLTVTGASTLNGQAGFYNATVSQDRAIQVSQSGARTATNYGAVWDNTSTSSTASIDKYGLYLSSVGTWNGAGATNYGIRIHASGGTTNTALWVSAGDTVLAGTLTVTGASTFNAGITSESANNYLTTTVFSSWISGSTANGFLDIYGDPGASNALRIYDTGNVTANGTLTVTGNTSITAGHLYGANAYDIGDGTTKRWNVAYVTQLNTTGDIDVGGAIEMDGVVIIDAAKNWVGNAIDGAYIGNLAASKITSGELSMAQGGTGANLQTTPSADALVYFDYSDATAKLEYLTLSADFSVNTLPSPNSLSINKAGISLSEFNDDLDYAASSHTHDGSTLNGFTAYTVTVAGPSGTLTSVSGVGTSGQVLTSNGASALPTWQTVTAGMTSWSFSTDTATGDTEIGNAEVVEFAGGDGVTTSHTAGVNTVTIAVDSTVSRTGHAHAASDITSGAFAYSRGGTNATSYTTWGVIYAGASAFGSTAAGTSGQFLKSNATSAPTWATVAEYSNWSATSDSPVADLEINDGQHLDFNGGDGIGVTHSAGVYTLTFAVDSTVARSTGDTFTGDITMASGEHILSASNNTSDVGSSGTFFRNAYFAGTVDANTIKAGYITHDSGEMLFENTAASQNMVWKVNSSAANQTLMYWKFDTVSRMQLDSDGDLNIDGTLTESGSDARMKDGVRNVENAWRVIDALRPVYFKWNSMAGESRRGSLGVGMIAQEVQSVWHYPIQRRMDGFWTLKYSMFVPLVLQGLKDHREETKILGELIEDVESRLAKLEERLSQDVETLKSRIDTLEKQLRTLVGRD